MGQHVLNVDRLLLLVAGCAVIAVAPARAAYLPTLPWAGDRPVPSSVRSDLTPERQTPVLHEVSIEGATVLRRTYILRRLDLRLEEPLPKSTDELAADLERRYHRQGYSYARVTVTFEESSGRLSIVVDEGQIDQVEFQGVDDERASRFAEQFGLRAGDVFNERDANRSLRQLLAPSHGALVPGRGRRRDEDSEGRRGGRSGPFELVEREGQRVLVVHLRQDEGNFDLTFGTEAREDWYSPVDGLNLALGFNGTVFDQHDFDRTFIEGYVSRKFERDEVGYTLGFERSLFSRPTLYVGAELHDLTATDDGWRLSATEQSLVALTFKNTFRDYHRRRGYQLNAALRFHPAHEVLASWRDERHETLVNQTNRSFWRDSRVFRPNSPVQQGKLHALVLGYTWDSRGFGDESLERTFRRHLIDDFHGTFAGQEPGARAEWTSEIASPGAFGGELDFRRHILNARAYMRLSPRQYINARVLTGFSDGDLPLQRRFALGGIGSVRGYAFKEAVGEGMILVNAEYKLDLVGEVTGVAFFDAGRVYSPIDDSTDDWLKGVGFGVELGGDFRVDFGYRLDDIPQSLQILVRFRPLF